MSSQFNDLKERIEHWLNDEGIPFEPVRDINSYFHLKAQLKNIAIHVHSSKIRIGCVIVQGMMALDPDQVSLIRKIGGDDQKSLFLTFFSKLDMEEYLFQLNEDFADPNWLRIQRTLYAEDLTRTKLLTEMKDLNTKFVDLNYELNEALDLIPPISNASQQVYT